MSFCLHMRATRPLESFPCFATVVLHLEDISSHGAAAFSLGEGAEEKEVASQLSPVNPLLFLSFALSSGKRCWSCWHHEIGVSLQGWEDLLGQFHGQPDKNVWETHPHGLPRATIPFPPSCGGTSHSLPSS